MNPWIIIVGIMLIFGVLFYLQRRKMHIELRGKTAYVALAMWAGTLGGLVYLIIGG